MAKSLRKVILFSRVKDGNKTVQWPTAVFNNHEDAKTFATILSMAHKSGDAATAKSMDAQTKVTEDDKLVPGLRFSIVEVPYSPEASLGASDMIDADETPTT